MKNLKRLLSVVLLALSVTTTAQNTNPTIAVANPNINSIEVKPEIAAKMLRLELIKLGNFIVLDEFDMADVLMNSPQFTSGCYG
jgi:hypothetical protein